MMRRSLPVKAFFRECRLSTIYGCIPWLLGNRLRLFGCSRRVDHLADDLLRSLVREVSLMSVVRLLLLQSSLVLLLGLLDIVTLIKLLVALRCF